MLSYIFKIFRLILTIKHVYVHYAERKNSGTYMDYYHVSDRWRRDVNVFSCYAVFTQPPRILIYNNRLKVWRLIYTDYKSMVVRSKYQEINLGRLFFSHSSVWLIKFFVLLFVTILLKLLQMSLDGFILNGKEAVFARWMCCKINRSSISPTDCPLLKKGKKM
jgi:hypothetical protein